MKRRLTGIGWDHPRGFGCYEGSGVAFMREHPDIELVWEKRSLRAFGEAPIDDLAELYDLVVFDHPFVGRAHATRAFLDLKEIVPDVVSAALADELGQAARSMTEDGSPSIKWVKRLAITRRRFVHARREAISA